VTVAARACGAVWRGATLCLVALAPMWLGKLQHLAELYAHLLVLAAVAAYLLEAALRGKVTARVDVADLAGAVFLALVTAATFASVYLHASVERLCVVGDCLVVFWLVRAMGRSEAQRRWAAWALVAGGATVACLGLREYIATAFLSHGVTWRAFATFFNPNAFGGYLAIVLPVAGALALSAPRREPRYEAIAGGFVVLLAGTALLVTGSKGALLGLLAGGVLFVVVVPPPSWPRVRLVRLGTLAGLLALVAGGALLPPIRARLQTALGSQRHSLAHRYYTWVGTWRMAKARPLLGHGPGTFEHAYPRYALAAFTRMGHEVYLQIAAEEGFAALAVFLLWVGSSLLPAGRALKAAAAIAGRALPTGVLAGATAFLVHGLVDYGWQVPALGLAFSAVLALGAPRAQEHSAAARDDEEPRKKGVKRARNAAQLRATVLAAVLGCAAALLAGVLAGRMAEAERALKQAQAAIEKGRHSTALFRLDRAIKADPAHAKLWVTRARIQASYWRTTGDPGRLLLALRDLRRAARLQPTEANPWYFGAKWEYEAGDYAEAVRLAGEALRRYPTFTRARMLRARALEALGREGEALEDWRELARLADTPLGRYPAVEPIDETFAFAWRALAQEACRLADEKAAEQYRGRGRTYLKEYFVGLRSMEAAMKVSGRWDQELVDEISALQAELRLPLADFCREARSSATMVGGHDGDQGARRERAESEPAGDPGAGHLR